LILVIRKNSTLDRHGEYVRDKVKRGFLPKSHLERLKTAHDEHYSTFELLLNSLTTAGLPYTEVERDDPWPSFSGVKYVITVGGDGTVLEASHHIPERSPTLIGVRSSPSSVGFLCYKSGQQISDLVTELLSDTLSVVEVDRVKASIFCVKTGERIDSKPVLNDFLYTASNPAETTRYLITCNGRSEVQKSSGIWISTAAGSTAAISAAGGKIYPLNHRGFQYVVREAYCPPGQVFGLIGGDFDPDSQKLEIENRVDQGLLALDGHHGSIELGYGDRIQFDRAESLLIARSLDRS
jgi:NAD+ kinase